MQYTFCLIHTTLQTCIDKKTLSEGKKIHFHISDRIPTLATDTFLQNKIFSMHDKCGSVADARKVFNIITEPDGVSWNMIIAAYRRHRIPQEALTLFHQMQQMPVQPDQFTLSGYAQNGILDEALRLFNEMPQPNVVSWTAIIAGYAQNEFAERALEIIILSACAKLAAFEQGYVQNGLVNKAVEVYKQMQLASVMPDEATFASILPACAKLGALEQGKEFHQRIIKNGILWNLVTNALIYMYAKCGTMYKARQLFDNMSQSDVVSWNAMIEGYAMNGYTEDALKLFELMKHSGTKPDRVIDHTHKRKSSMQSWRNCRGR
ncbi:pentatricopeptide repeat-containing protein At3g24000, mitochondrial-like isoform X2 [Cryptomeria japonica]|uniref:pentatricopeptide repeat-containing protein At3g24000, mitochondrial-like isoform X2 n=1 Tax=Cryptomeria japonica TaxID=3369 RepID=UPI0025AC6899|nr:pentatricopeptide repeat-containing protein At3g24000, mitochondrial-like isoform X2 [Cryptomeria japonica]